MKLFRVFLFIIVLPALFLLEGCTSYYHYPTQQNVMRFKKKGDAYLSYAPFDREGFITYSAGYAVSDHVAIVSDFKTFDGSLGEIDDYLWEHEVVVFTQMKDLFYPSINFGYGFGELDRTNTDYSLGISRQSVLPPLGISHDFFDLALSARFSRVNHKLDISQQIYPNRERHYDFRDVGKRDFFFVEPAITGGVGYKWVKLRGQFTISQKLGNSRISYYSALNLILSLNVTFNIIDLFGGENKADK